MSSQEYSEWLAFYERDPFGDERADMRSAVIASTMANLFRGEGQKPVDLEKFMLKLGERYEDAKSLETPRQSREQVIATLEMMNAMFGGRDLRKKK